MIFQQIQDGWWPLSWIYDVNITHIWKMISESCSACTKTYKKRYYMAIYNKYWNFEKCPKLGVKGSLRGSERGQGTIFEIGNNPNLWEEGLRILKLFTEFCFQDGARGVLAPTRLYGEKCVLTISGHWHEDILEW